MYFQFPGLFTVYVHFSSIVASRKWKWPCFFLFLKKWGYGIIFCRAFISRWRENESWTPYTYVLNSFWSSFLRAPLTYIEHTTDEFLQYIQHLCSHCLKEICWSSIRYTTICYPFTMKSMILSTLLLSLSAVNGFTTQTPNGLIPSSLFSTTESSSPTEAPSQQTKQPEYGVSLDLPGTYVRCGRCATSYAIAEEDLGGGKGRYVASSDQFKLLV